MLTRGLLLVLASLLCACTSGPGPVASDSGTGTGGGESETTETSETSEPSETDTGEALVEVSVKWIEVAASDYKLELQPGFDPAIHQYTALADGPDIAVYVDVLVDADLDAVLVNAVPAELIGFRLWRSAPATGLVSPTMATVEVELDGAVVPDSYTIDVVAP